MIFELHDRLETVHFFDLGLPPREPPRPVAFREPDYLDKFDQHVMIYDVIRSGDSAIAICPDLSACNMQVEAATFFAEPSGEAVVGVRYGFDRHARILFEGLASNVTALRVAGPCGEKALYPGRARLGLFDGRRCLLTISKNNSLEWIVDWARFHVQTAGADALLLYDNGTTLYTPEELAEALADTGLEALVVVRWPYKWGPLGFQVRHRRRYWDSNFAQIAMFEHARWKYLAKARSVLNLDVDELAVSNIPGHTVFESVEAGPGGYMVFEGVWIEAGTASASHPPRHRDFRFTNDPPSPSPTKWACVPARTPEGVNWATHALRTGRKTRYRGNDLSQDAVFFHFRGVTSAWKTERKQVLNEDATRARLDEPRLAAVFAEMGWR